MLKKLLLVALACIGGYVAYKKTQHDKVDEEVWGEAVDRV